MVTSVAAKKAAAKKKTTAQNKSGLVKLAAGEILFNENDPADSLYIIQKGQLRLYKPKGKGFIELAVLRAGEVIGEMAFFDASGNSRRSCSVAAITEVEVIEISFLAFGKTMESLNPWFKTIIETLADRLRKANHRIKDLESNQVSIDYGGSKNSEYKFFLNAEVVKLFSLFFLVFKSHSEVFENGFYVHMNTIKFYSGDIFNIFESKFQEFLKLIIEQGLVEIKPDKEDRPNLIFTTNVPIFRQYLIFFNAQRMTADDKKVIVSPRCEMFLEAILQHVREVIPEKDGGIDLEIDPIIEEFKSKNIIIDQDDLADARRLGLCGDTIIEDGKQVVKVMKDNLVMMYPNIKMLNALNKLNETKAKGARGAGHY